jgi:hypothetical protein
MSYYYSNNIQSQEGGNTIDRTDEIQSRLQIKINIGDDTHYNLQTINTIDELQFLDKETGIKIYNDKNYTGFIIWGLLDYNNLDKDGIPMYYSDFGLSTKRSGYEAFRCGTTVIRCTEPSDEDTYGHYIKEKYIKYKNNDPENIYPAHCFNYNIILKEDGPNLNVSKFLMTGVANPHARIFETIFCNETTKDSIIPEDFLTRYIKYLRENKYELLITGITKAKDKEWELKSGRFNNFSFYNNDRCINVHRSPDSDLLFLSQMNEIINNESYRSNPNLNIIRSFFVTNNKLFDKNGFDENYILKVRNEFIKLYESLHVSILDVISIINKEITTSSESKTIISYNDSDFILKKLLNKLTSISGLKNEIIGMTLPRYTIETNRGYINIGENEYLKKINYTQSYHITRSRDNKQNNLNLTKSEPLIITDSFLDCVKNIDLPFEFNGLRHTIGLYLVDVYNYNISCVYSNIDNIRDDHMYFIDFYNKEQRDIMFDGQTKIFNLEFQDEDIPRSIVIILIDLYKSMIINDNIALRLTFLYKTYNFDLLDLQSLIKYFSKYLVQFLDDLKHIITFLKNIDLEKNFQKNSSLSSILTYLMTYSNKLEKTINDNIKDYLLIRKKIFEVLLNISIYIFNKIDDWKQPEFVLFYETVKEYIFSKSSTKNDIYTINYFKDYKKKISVSSVSITPIMPQYYYACNKDCHSDSSFIRYKDIRNNINLNYIPHIYKKLYASQILYCGDININSNIFATLLSQDPKTYLSIDIINLVNFLFNNKIIIPGWEKRDKFYLLKGTQLSGTLKELSQDNIKTRIIQEIIYNIQSSGRFLKKNPINNIKYFDIIFGTSYRDEIRRKYNIEIFKLMVKQIEVIFRMNYEGANDYQISSLFYIEDLIAANILKEHIAYYKMFGYYYLIDKNISRFKSNLDKCKSISNIDNIIMKDNLNLEIDNFITRYGVKLTLDRPSRDFGLDRWKNKYLKWKNKYIELKNIL